MEKKKKNERKKRTNSSRKVSPLSYSRVGKGDLRTMLSWRLRNHTKEVKDAVCQEYMAWSDNPNSLDWVEFFAEQGIPVRTWQDWCQADQECKQTHEYVKMKIGVRHNKIARFPKKYDANPDAFMKTMRLYVPDYREIYDEDQRNKEKDTSGAITVVLDHVEETDVPVITEGEG